MFERPNDQRGFLHKSFIGRAVGGLVKRTIGATPIGVGIRTGISLLKPRGAEKSMAADLKFPGAEFNPCPSGQRLTSGGNCIRDVTLGFTGGGGGGGGPCPPGTVLCDGNCVSPKSDFGKRCLGLSPNGAGGGTRARFPSGDAVLGQFGAALEPETMTVVRRVCRPGMQLGLDGLCYNKGAISNRQREWPRGRRPLLTGGDMRAISVAARAGTKLDSTTKRLRSLGMMKRLPAPRKAPAHQHAKALTAVSIP